MRYTSAYRNEEEKYVIFFMKKKNCRTIALLMIIDLVVVIILFLLSVFISEKGPDCILSKQEGIKACLDKEISNNSQSIALIENLEAAQSGTFNFSHEATIEEKNQLYFSLELEQCR